MRKIFLWLAAGGELAAGPYAPPADEAGSDAVAADDPAIVQWATGGTLVRGKTDIRSETSPEVSFGEIGDALGMADSESSDFFSVVSLGDGGSATLTFARPIQDVPGSDFAVFENSFDDFFLELAHVEVSSDGVNFYRFPSVSLTQTETQVGTFGNIDATDLHNLAGKYRGGFGTPFDLAELKTRYPALDTQRITHVRVVDVVGSIDPGYGTRDSQGNLINDPFQTDFFTGGFDLDAVGAFSELPGSFEEWLASQGRTDVSTTADFLGNGVPQLVEFLTGGTNVEVKVEDGVVAIEFDWLSYREGVSFWLEGSDDLKNWLRLATSINGGDFRAGGGAVVEVSEGSKKKVKVLPPGGYRYFRLGGV